MISYDWEPEPYPKPNDYERYGEYGTFETIKKEALDDGMKYLRKIFYDLGVQMSFPLDTYPAPHIAGLWRYRKINGHATIEHESGDYFPVSTEKEKPIVARQEANT